MQFSIQRQMKNKNAMTNIVLLTALAGFGCVIFGYLLLPVAAGLYATLLTYESYKKRVFSFILPTLIFVINILFNGIYSLDGVAYLIVALLIYFFCRKEVSKSESLFWISLFVLIMFVLSGVLFGVTFKTNDGASGVVEFYTRFYNNAKNEFCDFLASIVIEDSDGAPVFAYTYFEAEILFSEIIILIVPIVILLAIFVSALSLKIFGSLIVRYSGEESGIYNWTFIAPSFVAYFYLMVAVLSVFTAGESGMFAYVVMSLNIIFAPVFAYVGAHVIHALLIVRGKSSFFAISLIIICCLIFYSFAITVLSLLGIYFTINANKNKKLTK